MSEINAFINAEKKRTENLIVHALSYLGELCVIEARDRPQEVSWIDRSGNLCVVRLAMLSLIMGKYSATRILHK